MGAWELCHPDSRVQLYVDPTAVVKRIDEWVQISFHVAENCNMGRPPPPLVLTGFGKTGKTYCQTNVVPAAVAKAVSNKSVDSPWAGMVLLRLNMSELNRKASLKKNPCDLGVIGTEIRHFLRAVEVPVLVLCDELQSLFLPTSDDKQDIAGAHYIRDCFTKYLLLQGSRTMLWCLTGSTMAQTWIDIADMPSNGDMLFFRIYDAVLPATQSRQHMELVWKQLQQDRRLPCTELDPLLLQLCPPSVALLTVMVEEWVVSGQPADVRAFTSTFIRTKVLAEGVLHDGLVRFLTPHLQKMADGHCFIRDSYQRQILKLLMNPDGTLRDSWGDQELSATLVQLDGGWMMLRLGEVAHYLLGPPGTGGLHKDKLPSGPPEFRDKLQVIALEIAEKLERAQAGEPAGGGAAGLRELWTQQLWFQNVLKSPWNDRDRAWYGSHSEVLDSHLDMLVFYLCSNVLVDVRVIEALPSVLDQPLSEFVSAIQEAFSVLERKTVEAAVTAVAGELPDGRSVKGSGGGVSGGSSRKPRRTNSGGGGGATAAS
ncbi:hypothetical protein GPECTOR_8g46 [Gonium pectorale]|uniref:Uncharacterized protein n=1 Tax=Gonium pectorale TaxID=33097 RepID=A0A150GTC0_GONPE|nr:hypothetical protein GPECTOR_8g46 [Gonium pectorale]|eukprot:KXZ53051.1 hypothetical protein GPECTOR_8g46 [Gonium pectorale]